MHCNILNLLGLNFDFCDFCAFLRLYQDCNLRFICFLEFVIWDFKDTPKPPPAANRSHILREQILSFERHCARLPFRYCVLP